VSSYIKEIKGIEGSNTRNNWQIDSVLVEWSMFYSYCF